MPRRVKSTTSEAKRSNPVSSLLSKILKINIVYILGFLLLVASFLIGVLITKVSYLEGNGGTAVTEPTDDTGPVEITGPVDVSEGHLPVLGNKDAKVTIIEFSDFQCPFCKTLFDESLAQIKKDYVDTGKAKFAYRHYPLTSIHPNAQKTAEATECANEQGKFWEYHDQLFTYQADWETLTGEALDSKLNEYAVAVGIDGTELLECVTSNKFADKVGEDISAGNEIGVDGTPATFINGIKISGAVPYEEFKAEIERALEE
ncbi:MAG: DsbA family protein [Candidatus Levybacteria bacterium]|nr:DsbA family protein [Candidatus Levybacteria bacterium]